MGRHKEAKIDLFDTKNISFFLKQEMIDPNDPEFVLTIDDKYFRKVEPNDGAYMRFSRTSKFLYFVHAKHHIKIYDLQLEGKEITESVID
jgi:hypothetical protein